MKSRLTFFLLAISFLFLCNGKGLAQVTIGNNADPEDAALLEVSSEKSTMPGGITSTKGGMLLPRVELVKKNELLPFVDSSVIGTGSYENITKLQHTGLIVYNIATVESEDLAPGLNIWTGSEWTLLGQSSGMAKYTISDCSTLDAKGAYKKGIPLNTTNYLTLNVSVTTTGSYDIIARPASDNGYYFSTQGNFLTKGVHSITLMGSGTPLNSSPSPGDEIKISFNGIDSGCSLNIIVGENTIPSNYTIDCGSITTNGVLPPNLVTTNQTIGLQITAQPNSLGGDYSIYTDEVDGVKFAASGKITSLKMDIVLRPTGTTNAAQTDKTFTITTNSTSDPTQNCSVIFDSMYTAMKITSVGGYWNPGRLASGYNKFLTSEFNFGATGTLPTKSISIVGTVAQGIGAAIDQSADIIIINYPTTLGPIAANALAAYIEEGGVVLFFCEEAPSIKYMFSALREISVRTATAGDAGTMHNLANTDDPVLNGVFGDVRGKQIVEDRTTTISISGYSDNIIPLASSPGGATVGVRHATKGFVWFGDAGIDARVDGNAPGAAFPWNMDANGVPKPTSTSRGEAQNTIVVANAVAWAIKYAAEYGINHK